VRISGTGADTTVSRLEPIVAQTGGPVALEAAWRATLDVARVSVGALRRRLAGEPVKSASQAQAIRQIDHFLESVALDTIDPTEMELRLVRLCHALDHLSSLERDLGRIPPPVSGWQPPVSFDVGAHVLAAWLDASHRIRMRRSTRQSASPSMKHPSDSAKTAEPGATNSSTTSR